MTIRLPTDIESEDINQWLSEGYVFIGGELLLYQGDLNEDGDALFYNGSNHVNRHVMDAEIHWPICGMINCIRRDTHYVKYVQRRQRRQWRRAFNTNCVRARNIGAWAVQKRIGRVSNSLSFPQVQELFDPTYYTVKEAMHKISQDGWVGVAMSPAIAMIGDGKGQYAVYYREKMVGGIKDGAWTPSIISSDSGHAERFIKEGLCA